MYLNDVYFGQGCSWGQDGLPGFLRQVPRISAWRRAPCWRGLIKGPNYYSPYFYPENARKRRNIVLDKQAELGYIDAEQATAAKMEPVNVLPVGRGAPSTIAPYFVQYVINYLKQNEELKGKFDNYSAEDIIYRGGLRIYTTIDLNAQQCAEDSINSILNQPGDPTGALCAVDPRTGEIKAMVGGRDFTQQQYNIAAQGGRQPRLGLQGVRAHGRSFQRGLAE